MGLQYKIDEATYVLVDCTWSGTCTGTLQKHLLKQDQRSDDDVLVALAGLKQV